MLREKSVKALIELFGESAVISDPAELLVYEVDAAQDRGRPDGVVFPASAEQLRRLALWAAENQVPLVSRGAGTGLSGGAVAEKGGLIVEFSRMNTILSVDESGPSVVVEPGLVTQKLDDLTRSLGLYYPPDPSSGRSSSLGGNVAENAGGPHCYKYGVTSNYITGLEVVLADGQLVSLGGRAFDTPEYDFSGVFTGSEGTLGFITRIKAYLLRQPAGIKTLMAAFESIEAASRAVSAVIAAGLVPATIELMDRNIIQIVEDYVHAGLPVGAGAILIVDVDGYPAGLDAQLDEISAIFKANGAYELRLARDASERERIWYGRKSAVGALARLAPAFLLLDGTIPRSQLAGIIQAANQVMDEHRLKVGYLAHAGDGNLHPLILMYPQDKEQVKRVWQAGQAFMQIVTERGGSITGEHGVGIEKRAYLKLMYSPVELNAMLEVKQVFDPQGLLNPGKIFPPFEKTTNQPGASGPLPEGSWLPKSAEEAALGLAALQREGRPVLIDNDPGAEGSDRANAEVLLKTGALNSLVEVRPEDLYVTAEAGMRLSELQEKLAEHGAWVPVFSPWPETTLGGMLASNLNAPSRTRYGGIRDQLLALEAVLPDGRQLKLGRPVVKNVAGYDLAKLFVGSHGTLGLITSLTLKFTSLPRARKSLVASFPDLEACARSANRCKRHARVASAIVITPGSGQPGGAGAYQLTYTAEGLPEDVRAELALVASSLRDESGLDPLEDENLSGVGLWQASLSRRGERLCHYRCAVPVMELEGLLASREGLSGEQPFLADMLSGFIYLEVDAAREPGWVKRIAELRSAAIARGGYLVWLNGDARSRQELDPWGYRPEALPYMQKLKELWDPRGLFNTGKFLL
ncbi:MAG TPA: FAD-linked oxidase C-terminal domain-containing protein [Anaerolineales bacterium]|jgi:D-lactate dehydrogenase (cytochrome)